jgi:hypothetical protein
MATSKNRKRKRRETGVPRSTERVIQTNDWFADRQGKEWAVEAVNFTERTVRLRMVQPPTITVPLDELWRDYTLAGLRAMNERLAAASASATTASGGSRVRSRPSSE